MILSVICSYKKEIVIVFRTSRSEGEYRRGYLINIARVYLHTIKIDIK